MARTTAPPPPVTCAAPGCDQLVPRGRPAQRVWTVRLRRGPRVVVIATDLGWPSAHALARQLNDLIHPRQNPGAAID